MKTSSVILRILLILSALPAIGDVLAGDEVWVPPIGIPAPPFGITEQAPARPDPWTSSVPGFYYVEPSNPAATDTSNPYGTPSRPRRTIPAKESNPLPAGSVVEVHGHCDIGRDGIPNNYYANGTVANPIFIRGLDAASKPVFTGTFSVIGSSYLIIENIEFADDDGDLSGGATGRFGIVDRDRLPYDSHHIVLRHCDVHGNRAAGGIAIADYASESVISNIVIYDNMIHDNGDVDANFDQDIHGIAINGTNVNHVWIVDNRIARNSGDGIQINANAASAINHIYVGRNVSHHNKQSGMWTKTAADVIFSQNTLYGHRAVGGGGQATGYQYDPERVWFLFNNIYDNDTGIQGSSGFSTGAKSIYIIGNVIHNIHLASGSTSSGTGGWSNAAILLVGGDKRYVVNNTIYDVDAGINSPSSYTIYMYNNIISKVTLESGNHIYLQNPGIWELKNCIFYQNGGPARIRIGNTVYSLPGLKSATGKGESCLTADPLFTNAGAGDFHLQTARSPAVDSAIEAGIYATFRSLYGLDIAIGFDKTARPQGTAYDIGAFEFATLEKPIPGIPGPPKVTPLRPNEAR